MANQIISMNRKSRLTLGRYDNGSFFSSTIPSTHEDLHQLEERFNRMLYDEYALETGLCRKRRRIYDDLFTELIRMTKIHCSERGLLLERIRNEFVQWMNTYEELYSSSMAYGFRQYLNRLEEKECLQTMIDTLENNCQQLRNELAQQTVVNEDNHGLDRLRTDVDYLRSANAKLRTDLDNILKAKLNSDLFLGDPINYEKND